MLGEFWLSGMDSNHDKSLQRALCYHYTTDLKNNEPTGNRTHSQHFPAYSVCYTSRTSACCHYTNRFINQLFDKKDSLSV